MFLGRGKHLFLVFWGFFSFGLCFEGYFCLFLMSLINKQLPALVFSHGGSESKNIYRQASDTWKTSEKEGGFAGRPRTSKIVHKPFPAATMLENTYRSRK